jgi:hypothetical protein
MGQMPIREIHTTTTKLSQEVSKLEWKEIMFAPINLYTIGKAWI